VGDFDWFLASSLSIVATEAWFDRLTMSGIKLRMSGIKTAHGELVEP
jgi:hypothetical protein